MSGHLFGVTPACVCGAGKVEKGNLERKIAMASRIEAAVGSSVDGKTSQGRHGNCRAKTKLEDPEGLKVEGRRGITRQHRLRQA